MVYIKISEIEWDDGNRLKCQKHGVSLAEVEHILLCDRTRILDDVSHSSAEKHYIAVGCTAQNRWVFVAYTFRSTMGIISIRPISARYMHDKEVQNYGK